jgi:hypothetical protein
MEHKLSLFFILCLMQLFSLAGSNEDKLHAKIDALEQKLKIMDLRLAAILSLVRYPYVCETVDSAGNHFFGGGPNQDKAKEDALLQCLKATRSQQELKFCQKSMNCQRGLAR